MIEEKKYILAFSRGQMKVVIYNPKDATRSVKDLILNKFEITKADSCIIKASLPKDTEGAMAILNSLITNGWTIAPADTSAVEEKLEFPGACYELPKEDNERPSDKIPSYMDVVVKSR
jgi:hypothetical protein